MQQSMQSSIHGAVNNTTSKMPTNTNSSKQIFASSLESILRMSGWDYMGLPQNRLSFLLRRVLTLLNYNLVAAMNVKEGQKYSVIVSVNYKKPDL